MCLAAGRYHAEPRTCPALVRPESRSTGPAGKAAPRPLGVYGHGPWRADDLRQFLPQHAQDGERRARLIPGQRYKQGHLPARGRRAARAEVLLRAAEGQYDWLGVLGRPFVVTANASTPNKA